MSIGKRSRPADSATDAECARIILESAARYGGAESLMVRWARAVLGLEKVR